MKKSSGGGGCNKSGSQIGSSLVKELHKKLQILPEIFGGGGDNIGSSTQNSVGGGASFQWMLLTSRGEVLLESKGAQNIKLMRVAACQLVQTSQSFGSSLLRGTSSSPALAASSEESEEGHVELLHVKGVSGSLFTVATVGPGSHLLAFYLPHAPSPIPPSADERLKTLSAEVFLKVQAIS